MKERSKNFTVHEQIQLCQAWLRVSLDPVVGNDQTASNFFGRVAEAFNSNSECTQRTGESLNIHWRDTINKQVACFASALKLSKSIVRSGYNNEQYLADAHEYYKAQKWNKKQASFRLMHCWEILKDQPKWMRESSDAAQPAATSSVTPTQ
ncbi:hypothetical protein H257_09374 [Aphanomyces astaci]|uniref:No apical meristem-associated C-terminal domain-containing protein n=1 Tax=Aphanomyces astaci TaxID=112090 RepID=W4GBA4_APHAT|nr:hypothetical protein H257_09373 [Aphanomyces astaci]XP_009833879.1 hypothetical protein H257_09374 [Aphanomyces astaci]ETV76966.1 hypothetical protein H257_09373 [Aphanomyces astaci]ETV76967.1 hypothetical protein H257_09374 [Aphanomyces astaci]|eukprot:XP_009833878.1 hypothetical protein H257_09373 [Aphanomyces astaci]